MIKRLCQIIVFIAAIPFIAAIFIKNDYHVEREVLVDQPKSVVFNYVKQLKNQDNFSKWSMMDPNMIKTYQGIDGTVGFISAWESKNQEVGTGEQEIIAIDEGKRIDFELRFIKPFQATEPAYMTTETVSKAQTKVKWGFSGHMDYPMNLMFLFVDFEMVIGDDLQVGLNNLKKILETTQ